MCASCPTGTYSVDLAATSDSCAPCPVGSYSDVVGATAFADCQTCSAGKQQNMTGANSSDLCFLCPAGKYSEAGAGECEICAADTYSTGGATSCVNCPINSVSPSGSPAVANCSCLEGYTQNAPGQICFDASSECPAGTWRLDFIESGTFNCIACPEGTASNISGADSNATCLTCEQGKFSNQPGLALCVECPEGTFSGAIGANSSEVCQICPAGTNSSIMGATSLSDCEVCPEGTYAPEGASTCRDCPPNTVSNERSTQHVDCKCAPGSNGPDGGPCLVCSAGLFKPVNGTAPCDPCEAGKYSEYATKSSSCNHCPPNADSPSQSDAVTDCTCKAGYYGDDGTPCTACGQGTFKNRTGADPCTDCGAGYYNSLLALNSSSGCHACPAGTYSTAPALANRGDCLDCAAGKYAESEAATACVDCAPGRYSTDVGASNATVCVECVAGKYQEIAGADEESDCLSCVAGTYSYAGNSFCTQCPVNSTSVAEASGPHLCLCDPGYYGAVGVDCLACAAGTFRLSAGARNQTDCLDCAAGYSTNGNTGSSTCEICQAGKHAPPGTPACILCPWDSFSPSAGEGACTNCTLDYCEEGKYRSRCPPGSTQDSVCVNCNYKKPNTIFIGHGEYNDTCPYICEPPYKEDCLTGDCKKCDPGQYSAGIWDDNLVDNKGNPAPGYSWSCKPCPARGTCIGDETVVCNPQSYLIFPRHDERSTEQECEKCPLGATCMSGDCAMKNMTIFQCPESEARVVGEWVQTKEKDRYELQSCPVGYSKRGLDKVPSPQMMECQKCHERLQYILNPNTDDCQSCPPGLRCHGNDLVESVVDGAQWVVEDPIYRLIDCPSGYAVAPPLGDLDFDPTAQECLACPQVCVEHALENITS